MNPIKQSYEIMDALDGKAILEKLERCARVCYKSEDKIKDGSAEKLLTNIIKRGHESVLEHFSFTVRFITDRGVTHELVRHRIASFSQESTRYVNYKGCKTFVMPVELECQYGEAYEAWAKVMVCASLMYDKLIEGGCAPQVARAVLPNSTKTEIVVTANIREWRHILRLRTSKAAHPQMRALMIPLLKELQSKIPVLFDDVGGDSK